MQISEVPACFSSCYIYINSTSFEKRLISNCVSHRMFLQKKKKCCQLQSITQAKVKPAAWKSSTCSSSELLNPYCSVFSEWTSRWGKWVMEVYKGGNLMPPAGRTTRLCVGMEQDFVFPPPTSLLFVGFSLFVCCCLFGLFFFFFYRGRRRQIILVRSLKGLSISWV